MSCSNLATMSFSELIIHLIALAAVLRWIWRFLRTEHGRVRPGRTRAPDPDRCLRVSPRWDSQETEPTSRHTP